jgi:hypothetical protein
MDQSAGKKWMLATLVKFKGYSCINPIQSYCLSGIPIWTSAHMYLLISFYVNYIVEKYYDYFFFWQHLCFELRASALLGRCSTTWATPPALFCAGYFQDRVMWTICLSWLLTEILLISASQVARITGMTHWCPTTNTFWKAELAKVSQIYLTNITVTD